MDEKLEFEVKGRDPAEGQILAVELAAALKGAVPGIQIKRIKRSIETMEVGSTLALIISSGAATAVAHGVAAWLAKRQSAEIIISKDGTVKGRGLHSADTVRLLQIIVESGKAGSKRPDDIP